MRQISNACDSSAQGPTWWTQATPARRTPVEDEQDSWAQRRALLQVAGSVRRLTEALDSPNARKPVRMNLCGNLVRNSGHAPTDSFLMGHLGRAFLEDALVCMDDSPRFQRVGRSLLPALGAYEDKIAAISRPERAPFGMADAQDFRPESEVLPINMTRLTDWIVDDRDRLDCKNVLLTSLLSASHIRDKNAVLRALNPDFFDDYWRPEVDENSKALAALCWRRRAA